MKRGVGKIRHLHVKHLWLQETVAAGELVITNIPRSENSSDALTHPWTSADLPFWSAMGLSFIPLTPIFKAALPEKAVVNCRCLVMSALV